MKRKALFFLVFSCGVFCHAQNLNYYKEYNVRSFDIYGLTEARDTTFYVCGVDCPAIPAMCTRFDGFICKFDDCGDTLWYRRYPPLNTPLADFMIYNIRELPQGGLIAVATESTTNPNRSWWYLVRLDMSGNVLWTRTMSPLSGNESARYIEILGNNRYAIAGNTANNISFSNGETFACMTDSTGNVLWSNRYFEPNNPGGSSVMGLETDSIQQRIFLTYFQGQSQKTHLLLLDTNGNTAYDKSFNGYIESLGIRPDGKPVTSGRYWPGTFTHLHDPLNGDTLWKRRINPNDFNTYDQRVCGLSNNDVVSAFTMTYMANGTWGVDKRDLNGNFLYQADTFDVMEKRLDALAPISSGGYILAGHRFDPNGNPGILILAKMDDGNCNPNSVPEQPAGDVLMFYPNPVSEFIYLNECPPHSCITITDMTGKLLLRYTHLQSNDGIDIRPLENGLYLLHIEDDRNIRVGRFVKVSGD